MGAVFLFHDLYGYLMEMSPDVAELIEAFGDGADTEQTVAAFASRFEGADPREFVDVLVAHAILIEPDEDELEMIWAFVPIKGKWNVWHRRGERLILWTAWGERPVTQVMLDPEETAMWDAFDGEKRLAELRPRFDADKLRALVRRLVHSDVQAIKLSMMPWSTYSKRPAMAPPYLGSTMPYPVWHVGQPVPATPELAAYHRDDIADADAQFDHRETTLAHLLRVPHPALNGRTYGEALIDALHARGAIPDGHVRILEIGAGLGYVARDAIARLRALGRNPSYTIVELAPALAAAQQRHLDGDVKWKIGDALDVELPEAAFDLVICNEMVGDLPARKLVRADLGLEPEGGEIDPEKLRALGKGGVIAANLAIPLVDAPATFYLQTGAFELTARIAGWLAPGGTAVITEFGDTSAWPKLSTHLDHPELSTHFGQLLQILRGCHLDAKLEFVIDLLDFVRTEKGLVTARSHFRALQAMFANEGVELAKIGYTPQLLAAAVGDKLDLASVGELRWDRIEDRLMGLVPHEFKALVAVRAR